MYGYAAAAATPSLGDGGFALQAQLNQPVSVAVGGDGSLFVADQGQNRVRKIAPGGIITTFAGTGVVGSGGDGGPAISAQLLGAQAVTVDNSGRVYIGECYGTETTPTPNELRVVDSGGTIEPFAPGFSCVLALAVDNANNLYVSGVYLSGQRSIFKVSPSGSVTPIAGVAASGYSGDGGPALNAQFNVAFGLAFDNKSGTLYVADNSNHRVRAISSTGIVRTVAGTGVPGFSGDGGLGIAAQLNYPTGVAVDAAGNVYIADSANARIRMLTPSGLISTVGGSGAGDQMPSQYNPGNGDGGPAIIAPMTPQGSLAIDSNGTVYFPEQGLTSSVRAIVPSSSTVGCMYSVVPGPLGFTATGGSSTASVITAQTTCPWLAFSTTDWVNVTNGGNGIGNATVDFTASANPGSASRTAIIAIAGQRVTVSQSGLACTLVVGVSQITVPAAGSSGTISVSANLPDCVWSASANAPWLFVISGAVGHGNGTVSYSAASNSGRPEPGR